jgi:HEAT repeat protein
MRSSEPLVSMRSKAPLTPLSKRVAKITLATVAVAVAGAVVWNVAQSREPAYEGKTLTTWLEVYNRTSDLQQRQAADEAIEQIGTNAIPTLLRLLRAKDSARKEKVISLARSLRVIRIQCAYAAEWNQIAAHAFLCLGTNAESAVPALMQIAEADISLTSRSYAIHSLGNIGPPAKAAVPSLLMWATNQVTAVRRYARLSLSCIDPEAAARSGITDSP